MKAVVNAGPLIALGKLGLIHLLGGLYDSVLVPTAVHEEVVTHGMVRGELDAYAVQRAILRGEIVVVTVAPEHLAATPGAPRLQVGEQHAIALARQTDADWVLLDDLLAREVAQELGMRVKGTLGVVVEAHRHSLLSTAEVELIF